MFKRSYIALAAFLLVTGAASGVGSAQEDEKGVQTGYMQLPKKFGVGVSFYYQTQDYILDSLIVGLPGFSSDIGKDLKVDNETHTYHARVDYWVLPFVNVMGIIGHVDAETRVDLSKLNIPVPVKELTVKYNGLVYGGGFTIAGGYKRYFGLLTTYYTGTDLDLTDSSVTALVITPRVGMRLGNSAIYGGAMYQKAKEDHKGTLTVPMIGPVPFSVRLHESQAWNLQLGVRAGVTDHIGFVVEGGLGNRKSILAHGELRF